MNPGGKYTLPGTSLEDLIKQAESMTDDQLQAELFKNLYKESLKNKEDGKS